VPNLKTIYEKLDKRKTPIVKDFYKCRILNFKLLQVVCDFNKLFWNVCCGQLGGRVNGETFKLLSLYHFLRDRLICKNMLILMG
jgi:hypothetical protein